MQPPTSPEEDEPAGQWKPFSIYAGDFDGDLDFGETLETGLDDDEEGFELVHDSRF